MAVPALEVAHLLVRRTLKSHSTVQHRRQRPQAMQLMR
jgi:hypothetical protein